MDALLARFLPQFTALARSRVTIALDVARRRDFPALADTVRELHTLVGEAGLLGLTNLLPLARDTESKAKQLCATQTEVDSDALVNALGRLASAIDLVSPTASQPTS